MSRIVNFLTLYMHYSTQLIIMIIIILYKKKSMTVKLKSGLICTQNS